MHDGLKDLNRIPVMNDKKHYGTKKIAEYRIKTTENIKIAAYNIYYTELKDSNRIHFMNAKNRRETVKNATDYIKNTPKIFYWQKGRIYYIRLKDEK